MTTTLASAIKPRAEDSFAITFAPLSLEEIYTKSDDPANGAVVVMSGMVVLIGVRRLKLANMLLIR